MSNSRTLSVIYAAMLLQGNPMSEVQTRYASDRAGGIDAKALWNTGRALNNSVAATLSKGMFVVLAGLQAPAADETGEVVLYDKCPAGAQPDGVIDIKEGIHLGVRLLYGDMETAGAAYGYDYVVGTDGRIAKSGDLTYPTVANPKVVAIGWGTNKVMLGAPARGAQSAALLSGKITADSAAFTSDVRGDFSRTFTIDPRPLKVGDQILFTGQIKLVAPNTTTFQMWINVGGVDVFASVAMDPINAGDVCGFSCIVTVRTLGATGKIISAGSANVAGDVLGLQSSGGGLGDETTFDTTATAATCKVSGKFSAAGANSAILRDFRSRLLT